MTDKIKVAVRVRPFNKRELDLKTECVISMENNQTFLHQPEALEKERKSPKSFAFDHCFNSYLEAADANFSSQEHVFENLGVDILDNAFDGYNACIFAYGQTGSGKSYSMLGANENPGIIPRLCGSLFDRIGDNADNETEEAKVEVSYMEIYNEKVRDLLDPTSSSGSSQGLKVREHKVLGPYVDGLSQLAVISYQEISDLMTEGNKSRTVASTNMNNESSRSHAVFSVILTQTLTDTESGVSGEKVSRISLVDLAGSERAVKTGAVGERLKEGSNINKSLTTLGLVISKLADASAGGGGKKSKDAFVPYRDSTLTWLLKDNLGGNSKTVMVATISPAADNYEETLSTLRYADRAKRIVNHAVVNEDPNARIIRELRAEVDALKEMLKHAAQPDILKEKLSENEKLMKEISLTWEEKLQKTGQTQEDRRQALEKAGVSVQSSGIKVEKDRCFLVNLNSDPALNELLVYYLKINGSTKIGRGEDVDIQLSGIGIHADHCTIEASEDSLELRPMLGARSCVNGIEVTERTCLRNGDRILWGSNHFFRLNCPNLKNNSSPCAEFDWRMAQEEVMMAGREDYPMQDAIAKLEKQYEEDKQVALQKQRQEYERHFQQLKTFMSPSTPYPPYALPFDPINQRSKMTSFMTMSKLDRWSQERDESFKRSLAKLREDIVRANQLTREANFIAEEFAKSVRFSVTLQIPPQNLSPNRKRGTFAAEPAISVKRKDGKANQIWSVEKLEMKLIDASESVHNNNLDPSYDPFFAAEESEDDGKHQQHLIGVANVFLGCLFHDVAFDYHTPIISQQGEVAGRLQVLIQKVEGKFPSLESNSNVTSSGSSGDLSQEGQLLGDNTVIIRVTVKQATGLPPSLSNFVFCQYSLWGDEESVTLVPPAADIEALERKYFLPESPVKSKDSVCKFDHVMEFCVPLSEEFLEHCSEGALSIEVYGHKQVELTNGHVSVQEQQAKARSLADRWSELTRKLQFDVEVQELNDSGDCYEAVEVQPNADVGTAGIFQFRQGQQRRIVVSVQSASQNSGTLPVICEAVNSVSIGAPCTRSKLQKPLDSYQEEDLNQLRRKWTQALTRRKEYLDKEIKTYLNKEEKTEAETEREQSLVDQWVNLTEERNSVMVPAPGSGVPGAPADWEPPEGIEEHSPVIFLDLDTDDLSTSHYEADYDEEEDDMDLVPVFGHNSILPKEHGGKFFNLPLIAILDERVGAVCTWDSSIHDSLCLNRVTPANERAYLIIKAAVRLSHPTKMDLILRKRICFNVYKKHSLTDRLRRKLGHMSSLTTLGVLYEIVSNIPKASEELEDRESLAVMAANSAENSGSLNHIEQYSRGVSAVETILSLDHLRQKVAVKELLQRAKHKNPLPLPPAVAGSAESAQFMRKTVSVPNFSQVTSSVSADNLAGCFLKTSESFSDLKTNNNQENSRSSSSSLAPVPESTAEMESHNSSSPGTPRPTSLELNFSLNPGRTQAAANSKAPSNPAMSCENKKPLSTLPEALEEDEDIENEALARRQKDNSATIGFSSSSASTCQSSVISTTATANARNNITSGNNTTSTGSSGYDGSHEELESSASEAEDEHLLSSSEQEHEAEEEKINSIDLLGRDQNGCEFSLLSPPDISLNSISPGDDDTTIEEQEKQAETSSSSSNEEQLPAWIKLGESVQIRPNYSSGIVAFVGKTEFAKGAWIGVELDAPTGKNDGSVQGKRYFTCGQKRGVFVRPDKVQLDRRGRQVRKSSGKLSRANKATAAGMRHSTSTSATTR